MSNNLENLSEVYANAMQRALELAEKGRYKVMPNPCVGAVLLKDSKIIAEGYHGENGIDHAEIVCLKNAAKKNIDIRGATMIVTLEPCNHYGKTPPCSKTLVEAGIAKVIVGTKDPNPQASGGIEYLRQNNVEVFVYPKGSKIEEDCLYCIRDFLCWTLEKRPYTILKMGTTLDGKVATKEGQSSYITNAASRKKVAELRALIGKSKGAVLVGAGTFVFDNPKLTAREVECEKQPKACIILPNLRHLYNSYLLEKRADETIVFTSKSETQSSIAKDLEGSGIKIYSTDLLDGALENSSTYLTDIFTQLYAKEEIYYLLCEGGPKLAYFLLHDNLIDEYRQYIAPTVFADKSARSAFEGYTLKAIQDAFHFKLRSCQVLDEDIELIYSVK